MMKLTFFTVLLSAFFCANSDVTTGSPQEAAENAFQEMEYTDGASIEPKYLLPLVNVSVFSDNSDNSTKKSVSASLSRVLDFYNTELLSANWDRVKKTLTPACEKNVGKYIAGLNSGANWALKMDDSSGRYSSGWFWGNHYWTGSQSLCENIAPSNHNYPEDNDTTVRIKRAVATAAASPSQTSSYKFGKLAYSSLPPFPVSFYVLRINLNSSFTTEERIVHVGICLPKLCTDEDAQNIFEETSKASPRVTVKVEAVRSEHQRFNIWHDTTFRILCAVSCMVGLLLLGGTTYDLYFEHSENRKKVLTINCTTYTNPNHKYGDKPIKLDMSMPDLKVGNGKSGLYVVNNNNNIPTCADGNIEDTTNNRIRLINLFKELLMAFSVRRNLKVICDRTVGQDTISVIHGLKSISMAWVILGHTCIVAFKYSDNMEYRKVVQKEFFFQTISNGAFSVDTFFFTSGLLVSFLYFRSSAKGKLDSIVTQNTKGLTTGIWHFFGLIVYRFLRLSAPYLFVLGVVEVCMKWFNYNSVFEPPAMDHINCPQYWWRNILYINTLFPVEEMCMLWSWYLSDDTQFYIVGAIILILATSHFKSAASLLIIFMVSSWMTTGYIAFSNSHMPNSDDPLALFDKIYDKPWTRLGPYLVGMSVGWLLFKTDCRMRMSKLAVTVGWLVSSACLLSIVYGLYETDLSPATGAAYSALSHSAWAMGLGWVVVACSTGYGGYANKILSATILYPFSRVTYCAYLLHPILIRLMAMSMDSPLHLGKSLMIIIYLGQVVASYALSFVVSLAFEAPVVSMLRIVAKYMLSNKPK